jgi:hypothetical protein
MKNKLLILTLFLPLWIGCFYDNPADNIKEDPGSTYLSLRSSQIILPSDSVGELESITIESLRILVFSKETGKLVTNKLFSVGDLNLATYDSTTGNWRIDFSNMVVETKPGLSIIYVVLNESIMSISGQTLTGALNRLSTLTEMQNLVNTPLSYTTPLRVTYGTDGKPLEPPFIMSTFGEFDIPEGMDKDNPYTADLTGINQGFKLDRTMAKVTIDSLSSYPIVGGPTTNNVATSYIFILKMGLANVPMQYLWSPNRPQTTGYPVPPYNGSFQYVDFALEDPALGYYDRDWNGKISLDFTAHVDEVQEAKDNRIWLVENNLGANSYSLDSTLLDNYIRSGNLKPTDNYLYYDGNIENTDIAALNRGNWIDYIIAIYNDTTNSNYYPTWYNTSNESITPNITGGYWSLKEKDISYYVPEHILIENLADSATQLHVRAAKASLPDTISKDDSYKIEWDDDTWGDWVYSLGPGGINLETAKKADIEAALKKVWGYKIDSLEVGGVKYRFVRQYWKGFIRYRSGNKSGTLDGAQFQKITNSTDIKDFYLPVRNTPASPVDFNIYRNHEYKFSVHALEQWDPGVRSSSSGTTNTENLPAGSMVLRDSAK